MKIATRVLAFLLFSAAALEADPPLLSNADIVTRVLEGALDTTVKGWVRSTGAPSWIGWQVPMAEGDRVLCCRQRAGRGWQTEACKLEGSRRQFIFSADRPPTFMKSDSLVVLMRADKGQLEGLRAYSETCELDAGGRQVLWLEGVEPPGSVDFLADLIESGSVVQEEALMALALHATPRAAVRLAKIAAQGADGELRREALFWLAKTGATQATETILRSLDEDPDPDVREHAVFALSLLPDRQGIDILLEILQDRSRSSQVREQAFFWYVQTGDDQALDLIAEILMN